MAVGGIADRRHSVDFYDDVVAHVGLVADRLGQALAAGGTAFLVATADHRSSVVGALAGRFDGEQLRCQGRLVELDARHIAGQLVGDDTSDPVTKLPVESIRRARPPVGVYAEVVAVLWELGFIEQAVDLEGVWNGLLDEIDFSLLCGYPSSALRASQAADIHRVCGRHSELNGADSLVGKDPIDEVRASWPAEVTTPRAVRQFVRRELGGLVDDERCREAMLVASELVTNSVVHARSPVEVVLSLAIDGAIRVVVTDEMPTGIDERPVMADTLATTGRGLAIVEALSSRWGVDQLPAGKSVWAEMTGRHPTEQTAVAVTRP